MPAATEGRAAAIDKKLMEDADYRELYMKYLGTLSVLGMVSRSGTSGSDVAERIEACRADAKDFLKGRVDVIYREDEMGFILEVMR